MRLAVGLLLVGLWSCIPELQPPSSGTQTIPSASPRPTPSVAMEPDVSPQPSASPTSLVSADVWAGHPTEGGFKDGTGKEVRFNGLWGLTLDTQQNLYVADTNNHRIRKIDPSGNVTTLIGSGFMSNHYQGGFADGPALEARLSMPQQLLLLPNGDLWFTDSEYLMLRKLTPDGHVSTIMAANLPIYYTGPFPPSFPVIEKNACWGGDMTLGPDGQVYAIGIAGQICRIEANGKTSTLARQMSDYREPKRAWTLDGDIQTALLSAIALVFNTQGELYISDNTNGLIRKISKNWSTITTVAGDAQACQTTYKKLVECMFSSELGLIGSENMDCAANFNCSKGHRDGPAHQAVFQSPHGLDLDPQGNLYIADLLNNSIRKLSSTGNVFTVASILQPRDIIQGRDGSFYVSSAYAIYKFKVP